MTLQKDRHRCPVLYEVNLLPYVRNYRERKNQASSVPIMIGWDGEDGGMVSPVCPLEDLNAQFGSITKLMKGDDRTGESPFQGAMLIMISAPYAVLIQEAVTRLSHILGFSTGHAANACTSSPGTREQIPYHIR